jgi:hypothetical protein
MMASECSKTALAMSVIAARDHQPVAGGDDFLEVADGELVLDLGHDPNLAAAAVKQVAQQRDVAGLAHEGHGDEVHLALEGELEVGVVLVGERGQVHLHAGQIDVAAVAELAGGQGAADELVRSAFLDRLHAQVAVVDDDGAADLDVIDQLRVVDVGGDRLGPFLAVDREADEVADLEVERFFQHAGADGRSLRVEQQADLQPDPGGDFADGLGRGAHPLVGRVRHVEAKDIHPHRDEGLERGRGRGGRPEGGDDFGAAHGGSRGVARRRKSHGVVPDHLPVGKTRSGDRASPDRAGGKKRGLKPGVERSWDRRRLGLTAWGWNWRKRPGGN